MTIRLAATRGIFSQKLANWREFHEFIEEMEPSANRYIWRGQRSDKWKLEPSIDRVLRPITETSERTKRRQEHLKRFQFAVRGRRGVNPKQITVDSEWWALGQHYGLLTPLLDWTTSPFAAVFFAFAEEVNETEHRVVYGLNRELVERANFGIHEEAAEEKQLYMEFISPLSDENPRLVSQGGLFTRAPDDISIEEWVEMVFDQSAEPVLLIIRLPETERLRCLRSLNRMNINHLSLFPDVNGASAHANLMLRIADY